MKKYVYVLREDSVLYGNFIEKKELKTKHTGNNQILFETKDKKFYSDKECFFDLELAKIRVKEIINSKINIYKDLIECLKNSKIEVLEKTKETDHNCDELLLKKIEEFKIAD